jgi:hypothetical protein
MVRPAPIPSNPARSYSAPCRLPSPPRQCHHTPQQTPPPPRLDDGPVRRETALPWKTAPGWVQHRSPPQHMVCEIGCKPIFHSLKSRFANFRTGPKTNRTQLRRVIETLEPGDVLVVTRLDRLARSTRDLLNTLAAITERKAGFRSLGDAGADTTTSHGRLMLTVLGGPGEFERDLIRIRTRRRPGARQGGRQEPRPQTEAHPAPERGGNSPARRGRVSPRNRAQLKCQPKYDFPTDCLINCSH